MLCILILKNIDNNAYFFLKKDIMLKELVQFLVKPFCHVKKSKKFCSTFAYTSKILIFRRKLNYKIKVDKIFYKIHPINLTSMKINQFQCKH